MQDTTDTRGIERYRRMIEEVNLDILKLLNRRALLAGEVNRLKGRHGIPLYCPDREMEMLDILVHHNEGPFSNDTVKKLFREIFRASRGFVEERAQQELLVAGGREGPRAVVRVGGESVGAAPVLIAGPCAVESEEQVDCAARVLVENGVKLMRAGAFKPRSSPYSFQGTGMDGLRLLRETADRYGLAVVSEVMDTRCIEQAAALVDVVQIGARNMYNYDLLREAGRLRRPVLLKRGFSATIEELLYAAEYIVKEGNADVILCERGIRTFETQTRNTLDISAVPLLKTMARLPVIVDVSHAAGRKDIIVPLAKASLAAGADGVMVEMHPWPSAARSDAQQQLSPEEFRRFVEGIGLPAARAAGHERKRQAAAPVALER